jgi:anti-sigma B factor antagonist
MADQAAGTGPVVVTLPADIDVTNSEEVHEQLVAACVPGVALVIADLTSTRFCDSSGVHAIMRAYERAAACDVRLWLAVPEIGSVRRVLELTGVGRLVPVYRSLQEAVSAA